jgi:hypothetical protein
MIVGVDSHRNLVVVEYAQRVIQKTKEQNEKKEKPHTNLGVVIRAMVVIVA